MPKQTALSAKPNPRTNHFLARLEREDYDELMREAKIVSLKFRKRLLHQDAPIDTVVFPHHLYVFAAGHQRRPAADGNGNDRKRRNCRGGGGTPDARSDRP